MPDTFVKQFVFAVSFGLSVLFIFFLFASRWTARPQQKENNKNKCFRGRNSNLTRTMNISNINYALFEFVSLTAIPAAMSLPHFLNADPSLLEGVEGLHPDPEKHGTKVILQPVSDFKKDYQVAMQNRASLHQIKSLRLK